MSEWENKSSSNTSILILIMIIAMIVCFPVGLIILIYMLKDRKKLGPIFGTVSMIFSFIIGGMGLLLFIYSNKHGFGVKILDIILCPTFFVLGKKIKNDHIRYKKYVEIILNNHEYHIDKISAIMKSTYSEVANDILTMMKNDYLPEGEIDNDRHMIIIKRNVKCQNCGAEYQMMMGLSNECEYCGSELKCE